MYLHGNDISLFPQYLHRKKRVLGVGVGREEQLLFDPHPIFEDGNIRLFISTLSEAIQYLIDANICTN